MASFSEQLADYKARIDADIATYTAHFRSAARSRYGEAAGVTADVFADVLNRGGKRIRGALVMVGYEMCGGTNRSMIVRAATAIEMIHAHLLIIDDIQDRSHLRRGKLAAHEMLAAYHGTQGWHGDAPHAGVSLALDSAFGGNAAAQMLLAGLDADAELKIKVLGIVNLTVVTTAHGQTQDIRNEVAPDVTLGDVERAMEWKTANYTILNPLCVGMALAGAACDDTDAIRDYALATGKAFQITDDIIGVFGDESKAGKSNMDDIREGKRTLLTVYALEHATPKDRRFLQSCLGSSNLTRAELTRCQQIIQDSGARVFAEKQAQQYCDTALVALDREAHRWPADKVAFLRELTTHLRTRIR